MEAAARAVVRTREVGWLLALLLLCVGCGTGVEESPAEDHTLAVLGEDRIGYQLFFDASRARTARGEYPRSGSGFEAFRDRLILDLAFEEILLSEASRRGFEVDESDIEGARLQLVARIEDPKLARELVEERFGGEEAWSRHIERRLLVERAEAQVREELGMGVSFDAAQVADARMKFRDELLRPARLRASQIFSPDADKVRAAEAELAGGASFEDVAKRYGGGDMGWMSAGQAPDLLVRSTEGLSTGRHTPLLSSPLGYHIFSVTDRSPAARLTGDAATAKLQALLHEEAVSQAFAAWLGERSEALQLTIHEGNVAEVRCCRLGLPYWGQAQQED